MASPPQADVAISSDCFVASLFGNYKNQSSLSNEPITYPNFPRDHRIRPLIFSTLSKYPLLSCIASKVYNPIIQKIRGLCTWILNQRLLSSLSVFWFWCFSNTYRGGFAKLLCCYHIVSLCFTSCLTGFYGLPLSPVPYISARQRRWFGVHPYDWTDRVRRV